MSGNWQMGDPVNDANGAFMDAQNWSGGPHYDVNDQRRDNSTHVRADASQKINKVRYIVNSELSDNNSNLRDAMDTLIETIGKIDDCLLNEKCSEYSSLMSLKWECIHLKEKIKSLMIHNDKIKHDKTARGWEKGNVIHIQGFNIELDTENPFIKLVKENECKIVAYQKNNKIGLISNDQDKKLGKRFSNDYDISTLPKISYAKLFYFDDCKENDCDSPRLIGATLTDESQMKKEYELRTEQENILRKYAKARLITINRTGFYTHHELKQGMKLKLVREPDNIDDEDAIAVYLDDSKIGYVANNQKTNCRFTSMASELKPFPDMSHAEYLIHYNRRYHIARR